MYEKDFQSKSPIDKEKLSQLVNKIILKKPKTIVFDLDISPDYDFTEKNQMQINNNLYKLLIKNARSVDIILPFAFYSKTIENKLLKSEWFTLMCKNGINLGLPTISSEIGISLQYYDYNNSMSNIANVKNYEICNDVLNSKENIDSLLDVYLKEYKNSKQYPINYNKVNSHSITINNINDLEEYDFKNKTIFLGGAYGYQDKYITPYGEKYGVQIHESIFYSLSHKIDQANTIITLLADFLLAITFGFLIERVLHFREKCNNLNGLAFFNLILFAVLIAFIIGSAVVSSLMYHNFYIWLNPIPLIVGMFLDSIIGLSQRNNIDSSIKNWKNSFHYLLVSILILIGLWSVISTTLNI